MFPKNKEIEEITHEKVSLEIYKKKTFDINFSLGLIHYKEANEKNFYEEIKRNLKRTDHVAMINEKTICILFRYTEVINAEKGMYRIFEKYSPGDKYHFIGSVIQIKKGIQEKDLIRLAIAGLRDADFEGYQNIKVVESHSIEETSLFN